jgi:transcriptional regulator with XRE-family HTH domain
MALKLRSVRKRKCLSQTQLSEISGVHRTLISRYEFGLVSPTVENLQKLAAALNCTVDELIGKEGAS